MSEEVSVKELLKNLKTYDYLLLGLLLVSLIIFASNISIESMWPDEARYAYQGFKVYKDPSYLISSDDIKESYFYLPAVVIGFLNIFFDKVLASKVFVLLFSLGGIAGAYYLGKIMRNKFVGILSAAFFAFSPLYAFLSTRILLSIPLATLFLFVAICLMMYEKTKKNFWAILLGISMILCPMIKSSGLLIFLIVGLYFILAYREKTLNLFKRKSFLLFFSIVMIFLSLLSLTYYISYGSILPFSPSEYGRSYFFFLAIGLFFMLKNIQNKKYLYLLVWFIVYFLFFSLAVGEKVPRHMLPILPVLFIICSNGFQNIRNLVKEKNVKWFLIIVALIIIGLMYQQGNTLILGRENTYVGFEEAGEWIKENAGTGSIIYVGSDRAMQLYTEMDLEEDGGRLRHFPRNKSEFEKEVSGTGGNIFLEIDLWEYTQPEWIFPLTNEKVEELDALNFKPVYVVERTIQTQSGLEKRPAVIIFLLIPP
jgi:4-amino-4-deoxy-L-arabinose transferase-like glycosyltransferase